MFTSSNVKALAIGNISLVTYLFCIPSLSTNAIACRRAPYRARSACTLIQSATSGIHSPSSSAPTPSFPPHPFVRNQARILLNIDGREAAVVSRQIEVTAEFFITIWEQEKLAAEVEAFWLDEQNGGLDPFGLVAWPGSVVAAQELVRHQQQVEGAHVLVLGAGCGIEAQTAARLGAASVLATDIHPTTLQLLEYGVKQAGETSPTTISTASFDIASSNSLPDCDLMVVADVLYNDDLATHVVRRCAEARSRQSPPIILITDSQRFVRNFESDLNSKLESIGQRKTAWIHRKLQSFTGSGVAIDEDQTYDIDTRIIWINH